jgi:hypothetical protein
MYSQADLIPWVQALHQDIPDLKSNDAHVHLGLKGPAVILATEVEMLKALEEAGSYALIFPLEDLGGCSEASQRLLSWPEEHPDRLRTLAGVDPADDPLGESKRCQNGSAVGLDAPGG